MLHRIILVLTLLVAVGCTGDDTVIEKTETQVLCSTTGEILEEGETCPPPQTTPTPPPTTSDPDTDRGGPTRADCIQVQGVDLNGTDQNDIICGNDEDNTINGLQGDDTIYGGAGRDVLKGEAGRDVLKGEAGNDILSGGDDKDTLDGGAGTDTADYSTDTAGVMVNLVKGEATDGYGHEDTLISIEKVIGTSEVDTITGGAGADIIVGGAGGDTLDGGAGTNDTLSYENEKTVGEETTAEAVVVDLAANTATGGSADNDNIVEDSFENITGGDAGDTLRGDERANKLTGGGGGDTLTGGLGRDTLTGGLGADCFIVDATGAGTGDAETIMDFNKGEDAIKVCGTETAGPDGEALAKISTGGVIEALNRASRNADANENPPVTRVSPGYVRVATLTGSSTRLTAEEIAGLADPTAIGASITCNCPSSN